MVSVIRRKTSALRHHFAVPRIAFLEQVYREKVVEATEAEENGNGGEDEDEDGGGGAVLGFPFRALVGTRISLSACM